MANLSDKIGTSGVLTGITGESIKNLSDVYSSMSPTDGQALIYDTTNGWQAEDTSGGIGYDQSWQAVTRSANTVYQNTTGKPIQVYFSPVNGYYLYVSSDNANWVTVSYNHLTVDYQFGGNPIIPVGHYYYSNNQAWAAELR